jgi:hypothetical protein
MHVVSARPVEQRRWTCYDLITFVAVLHHLPFLSRVAAEAP